MIISDTFLTTSLTMYASMRDRIEGVDVVMDGQRVMMEMDDTAILGMES